MIKEGLKLIRLQVQGVRIVSNLVLDFKKQGLDEILGKNRQGKSTVIDCIAILLGGRKYYNDKMIQDGQKKMVLVGQLSDGTQIKRIFTEKSERLEVSKENTTLKSPQMFLDALINEFTLNPYPFLAKSAEEKVRFMMEFCGLDFSGVNKEIKELEQERIIVGREIKSFGELNLKLPERVEAIDIDSLYTKKEILESENEKTIKRQEAIRMLREGLKKLEEDKKRIEEQIKIMRERLGGLDEKLLNLRSVKEIEKEIREAIVNNQRLQEYNHQKEKVNLKIKKEGEYVKIQSRIKRLKEEKISKLMEAKNPVQNLMVQEDNLYLKKDDVLVSSENWSNSEGLLISLELCKAKMPKLRGIYYDEGERFDRETREMIDAWAIKNDMNVVVTRVDDVDRLEEGKIYIQEGKIIEGGGEMNVRRGTRSRQS